MYSSALSVIFESFTEVSIKIMGFWLGCLVVWLIEAAILEEPVATIVRVEE
jgi:hypothetical protein